MTSMPRDKLLQKWKMLWKCLVDLNVTSPQSCDETTSKLKSFVDDESSLAMVKLLWKEPSVTTKAFLKPKFQND